MDLHVCFSNISLVTIFLIMGKVKGETTESCNGEDYQASCQSDEVLLVTSAEYGRREMGRCITKEEPHMGCTNDVMPLLDRWCSGRKECEFEVPNEDLEIANTECPDYLKMYIKVDYTCIKVQSKCSGGSNVLRQNEAILSSHVTSQTGCGTTRSPWKISVSAGKTINMTLFDFAGEGQSQGQGYVTCKYVYGYIIEKSLGINHTICGGKGREVALYSSKTNNVEVHLNSGSRNNQQFLIKYEAQGCSELTRPANAWYKREGNEAVIGCETNDQEWRLTCSGNTWHGTVGNCSSQEADVAHKDIKEAHAPLDFGFSSVIIMTGIACAVVVAVVIAVMFGVIYLKKYRMKQETKRIQTTYATMDRLGYPSYRQVTDKANPPATDAPSERLVDVPGTWIQPDTFGRQSSMTSYPDPCSCPSLPGNRQNGGFGEPGNYETPKFPC